MSSSLDQVGNDHSEAPANLPPLNHARLLVVDDEENLRITTSAILENEGYVVDTAASGEFRINLPPDVLAEMRRTSESPRTAMQVDGFRPGIFGRLLDLVTGRRR